MGPRNAKPDKLESIAECKSDHGFKLIQVNLDANNNGEELTVPSIIFIICVTIISMLIMKRVYEVYRNCRQHYQQQPWARRLSARSREAFGITARDGHNEEDLNRIPRVDTTTL